MEKDTMQRAEREHLIVQAIADNIGNEAFVDGFILPERVVHVSEVSIIQQTCMVCGAVITGPDYNVWHILSAHVMGHRLESEQMEFNFSVEDEDGDNDDGGVPV